jgi:hypothetical protein
VTDKNQLLALDSKVTVQVIDNRQGSAGFVRRGHGCGGSARRALGDNARMVAAAGQVRHIDITAGSGQNFREVEKLAAVGDVAVKQQEAGDGGLSVARAHAGDRHRRRKEQMAPGEGPAWRGSRNRCARIV